MLRLQSFSTRYGMALVSPAIASFLTFLAGPRYLDSEVSYFGFMIAVLASALLGGLGPGLLATGLSVLGSTYLLLPPVFSIQVASEDRITRLVLFAGEGVMLSLLGNMVRGAKTADIEFQPSRRYLTALLFVSAATGLKLLAFPVVERELPFTFFYAAIAASAFTGGSGPGLLATLLASLAARYFFLDPRYSLSVLEPKDTARLGFFIVEGAFLTGLNAKYPKARRIVSDAVAQMRQLTQRMLRSVEDVRALRLISKDVIWELDLETDKMTRGATAAERPEIPAATMSFSSWLLQVHPEDRSLVSASLSSALQRGSEEWRCDYRSLRPGGDFARVSDRAYIIRDDARHPVRIVGRTADVSASNNPARAGGIRQEYWRAFEQNPLAILLTDNELHIVNVNPAAREVLGYSLTELTGMHLETLFEPGRRVSQLMAMLLGLDSQDHRSITIEEECKRADGRTFLGKIDAAVISGREGRSNGRVIMIENITHRK
jgi:PAS domain S-box-containing protein